MKLNYSSGFGLLLCLIPLLLSCAKSDQVLHDTNSNPILYVLSDKAFGISFDQGNSFNVIKVSDINNTPLSGLSDIAVTDSGNTLWGC